MKFTKYSITLFFLFVIGIFQLANGQGIIIADDVKQQALFSTTDRNKIISFANEISKDYPQVIIHLGRAHVFERGNIYSSSQSQENLLLFCNELKNRRVAVYLWFLDSYGSSNFETLYGDHESIIDDNLQRINQLAIPFDGIAVDMEWINKNDDNNRKYIEVIRYLRSQLPQKKIFCFASLVNNEETNSSRGYDTRKILQYADNIIDLLYLQDSDFFIFSSNRKPELNQSRIKALKDYYRKQGWLVAVSLQAGVVMENEKKDGFSMVPDFTYGFQELLNNSKFKHKSKNKLSVVYEYKVKKNRSYNLLNGNTMEFHRKQRVFYFKLKPRKLASSKDFIWEYFLLNS